MAEMKVRCIHCVSDKVSKMGFTKQGKQRYVYRSLECRRSFILEYSNNGCVPGITEKIVDMAINGTRDFRTALPLSGYTSLYASNPGALGNPEWCAGHAPCLPVRTRRHGRACADGPCPDRRTG
jgi:hypothetical protein